MPPARQLLTTALLLLIAANASAQSADAGDQPVRALLMASTESVLASQIDARIADIAKENGQRFAAGDLLIRFDCEEKRAELAMAEAERLAAAKTLEANRKLLKLKGVSKLDFAISEAKLVRARAEVALKRARVRHCEIHAPYAGRVVKRLVKPYQTVEQAEPLIEILDDRQLKLEIYAPSRWLSWLREDTAFQVRIDETGKTYPARVTGIGARVDSVSQTITLTAEIEGEHPELLAGMSGGARFTREE